MGADSVNAEIGFGEFLENNKQILDSLIIAGGWATEIQLAEDNVPISQKREHHDVDYILLNPTAQPYVKTGLDGFPLVAGDICYLPSTYGKSIFIPDSNWLEPFIERRNII
ncbi:MAG: hypothetical protein NDI94_06885, partial [Candidatus Woesearchaeota archaeon]|nr:hypothetical protein [Candidatus Woesearchaeota archaeon]